jgi:hypothetical protein
MESERDCAKVEAARSSRARSTRNIDDLQLPIADLQSCGIVGRGEGNDRCRRLKIGNRQLEIGNESGALSTGVAQQAGGASLRN